MSHKLINVTEQKKNVQHIKDIIYYMMLYKKKRSHFFNPTSIIQTRTLK